MRRTVTWLAFFIAGFTPSTVCAAEPDAAADAAEEEEVAEDLGPKWSCAFGTDKRALDLAVNAGSFEVGTFSSSVYSASASYGRCFGEDAIGYRFEGGFDYVDAEGRISTAGRIGLGIVAMLDDSKDRKSPSELVAALDVYVGYEDIHVPGLYVIDSFDDLINNPPRQTFYKDARTTLQAQLTVEYALIGAKRSALVPPGHRWIFEGAVGYVDKVAPTADAAFFGFDEGFAYASLGTRYSIPVKLTGDRDAIRLIGRYQHYFHDGLVTDIGSVALQLGFQTDAANNNSDQVSIDLRYDWGNADYQGISLNLTLGL